MLNARNKYLAKKAGAGATHKGPTQPDVEMIKAKKKKMTQAQDDAYDRKHGIKEGSKADVAMDAKNGLKDKKKGVLKKKATPIKRSSK